ncbi:diguanylate cyclase [Novimethylophilus kurashikiensis]|uniref:Diguanylate cyclase n=1 Tax=Novimethylophilus kurashikiensis TaxID=1825523 RepID=A0A2R5F3I8_9PROT|nr:EAL domain-containing protein [Novimethylophilus kurashikiensis]GBG13060.1 diguanylate cyclase [Novimethylophilus kurashikiensis]
MMQNTNNNPPTEILLAEDSPTQAQKLRYLLEQNGYHVTAAANGKLALEALARGTPQLIISDVMMPEMDGYQLCKAVKSNSDTAHIPVMLVTGMADVRDVMKGLECGADHFIRKPYDEKYLLSHIDYLLMNRRMRKGQAVQMGIEIYLLGQRHFITVERQQILDLLISIYEEAIRMNDELTQQQQRLEHSHQSLNGLYQIADGLNHATSEQEVVENAVEKALEMPGVQACWIWLRDGEAGFRLAGARHIMLPEFCHVSENGCHCQRRLLTGELNEATNILDCERLKQLDPVQHAAHVSIPLGTPDEMLGIMNLSGYGGKVFNEDELKIANGIGKQVNIALNRAHLHTQLERLVEQRTAALLQTQGKLDSILASMEDVVYSASAKPPHELLFLNRAAETMYGKPMEILTAASHVWLENVYPEDRANALASLETVLHQGSSDIVYRILRGDGEIRWLRDRTHLVSDDAGQPLRLDGIIEDITERKMQEERILRLNRVYAVLSGINMAIVHIGERRTLLKTACDIATKDGGFKLAWIGQIDTEAGIVVPKEQSGVEHGYLDALAISLDPQSPHGQGPVARALREGRPVICNDIRNDLAMMNWRALADREGFRSLAAFPIEVDGRIDSVFTLYSAEPGFFDQDEIKLLKEMVGDVGYALSNIQKGEMLSYLASYDGVSGLPNRSLLQDRLRLALAQASRNGDMVAVLFIDLDRFKNVNDSLGHNIGDMLLKETGERLKGCVREIDTVSRMGGDEFAVLMTDIKRPKEVTVTAQQILEAVARLYTVDEYELFLTASIGISLFPRDGLDEHLLLKNADTAMYRAKNAGKNRFEFFTSSMTETAMRRMELESQLRQALERQEFLLYYQPQADLKTGQLIGLEVLLRWQHPKLGVISPGEFIPILEETGLIVPIGEWILKTACQQTTQWSELGLPQLRIAVNLSARQFDRQDLGQVVGSILAETGFDPQQLELELTESIFIEASQNTLDILNEFRRMGIRLAVDDFGTGYSSLSYLRRFPVTAVKIDQSFVFSVTNDPDAAALVRSIISMAHELRLNVIAEGVETEAQLEFLAQHRCDEIQGFHLSKPLPAESCLAWMKSFTEKTSS